MTKKQALIILSLIAIAFTANAIQPDTLKIKLASTLPVIDGAANDSVWSSDSWINIDQVWIPFQNSISKSDFSGRYKVCWSATTNLLYFIAEITDDVFRDGYVYTNKDLTYGDYDIFEVFIDPNHSGGLHVFDGKCDDAKCKKCWGTNAENAFTYHINVNAQTDNESTFIKTVQDISGKSWHSKYIRNYADHLPDFAFRRKGNISTYEFSLKVYKDSFDPKKPSETDRDSLFVGKIMGLSVAYCDSDLKIGKPKRKNFIGSTKADKNVLDSNGGFNQAWMNASYFGIVKLINNF